jgi:hypothetical protein
VGVQQRRQRAPVQIMAVLVSGLAPEVWISKSGLLFSFLGLVHFF